MATEQRREKRAPSGPIPRAVHVLRVSSNDWKGAGPQGWFQSQGKTCKLRVFHKASVQNTTKFSLSLGPIRKDFAMSRLGVNLLLRAMSQNHYE